MSAPWLMALHPTVQDLEFQRVEELAAYILAQRGRRDLGGDMLPPEIKLTTGALARDALPGGAMVSVRFLDGSERGELLGYVLCPNFRPPTYRDQSFGVTPISIIMDAIIAADRVREKAA